MNLPGRPRSSCGIIQLRGHAKPSSSSLRFCAEGEALSQQKQGPVVLAKGAAQQGSPPAERAPRGAKAPAFTAKDHFEHLKRKKKEKKKLYPPFEQVHVFLLPFPFPSLPQELLHH